MTRLHDIPPSPENRGAKGRRSYHNTLAIAGPQLSYKPRVSNRMALLGMALGYLGLVAILTMAPLWNQTLLGYDQHISACTESGGSR